MSFKKFIPYKTEEELNLCPLCGSGAKEKQTHGSFGGYGCRTVYCQSCSLSADLKDWGLRKNVI